MKNETSQDELSRVLSNPSNLIVSDSLVGRIDFGEESNPIEIQTEFSSCGENILGRFKNYKMVNEKDSEKIAVSFLTTEDQLNKLFSVKTSAKSSIKILNNTIDGNLSGVSISSQSSELVVTVTIVNSN